MIFPEFEEMEIIEEIREKYDPLAHLVRPHITIVFPFENQMSNKDIADILADRLITIPPFELVLNGISKHEDRFGNYLFLNVKKEVQKYVQFITYYMIMNFVNII